MTAYRESAKHQCHALRCEAVTQPSKLMCRKHWAMVPASLQDDVYDAYRQGQEVQKTPTRAYARVARAAITHVGKAEGVI